MTYSPEDLTLGHVLLEADQTFADGHQDARAAQYYQTAYEISCATEPPDTMAMLHAARGVLESNHRWGVRGTIINAWRDTTLEALDQVVRKDPNIDALSADRLAALPFIPDEARPTVREIIRTSTAIGRLTLREALESEDNDRFGRLPAGPEREQVIAHNLWRSEQLLPLVEAADGVIDQSRIDWQTPAVFAELLYGSRAKAAKIAFQALTHATAAELPDSQTAYPALSESGRAAAVSLAQKRARAAVFSLILPRSQVISLGRRVL